MPITPTGAQADLRTNFNEGMKEVKEDEGEGKTPLLSEAGQEVEGSALQAVVTPIASTAVEPQKAELAGSTPTHVQQHAPPVDQTTPCSVQEAASQHVTGNVKHEAKSDAVDDQGLPKVADCVPPLVTLETPLLVDSKEVIVGMPTTDGDEDMNPVAAQGFQASPIIIPPQPQAESSKVLIGSTGEREAQPGAPIQGTPPALDATQEVKMEKDAEVSPMHVESSAPTQTSVVQVSHQPGVPVPHIQQPASSPAFTPPPPPPALGRASS